MNASDEKQTNSLAAWNVGTISQHIEKVKTIIQIERIEFFVDFQTPATREDFIVGNSDENSTPIKKIHFSFDNNNGKKPEWKRRKKVVAIDPVCQSIVPFNQKWLLHFLGGELFGKPRGQQRTD